MFSNSNPLGMQRELAGVTRVLSNNKIRTRFVGSGACATADTVYVPHMDPFAALSERDQRVIRGYHIHEVSHILHTDNDVWSQTSVDNETRGYWNAMEDVFVERVIAEKYAGARANLQVTVDKVLAGENVEFANEARTFDELPYAVLQKARKAMGYVSPALDQYIAEMPEWLATAADPYVPQALAANSTRRTLDLAVALKKHVDEAKKEQAEQEQKQKPEQRREQKPPQQGPGQPADDDEPQPQQQQGGEGSEQQQEDGAQQPQAGGAQENDKPEGDGEGGRKAGKGPAKFDLERALGKMADAVNDVARSHQIKGDRSKSLPVMTANPVGVVGRRQVREQIVQRHGQERAEHHFQMGTARYDEIVRTMSRDLRLYGARLARALLAQEERYWKGGETEGRLDRRRLAAIGSGSRNVFARQVEQHTDRVGVMVLFDASQSMNELQSRKALVALNECLGRTNCDLSIMYWHCAEVMLEAKPWRRLHTNEEVRECIANFGDWNGGTSPVKFLYEAVKLIQEHECNRRIILFCTDGEFHKRDASEISQIRKSAETIGVEVHGVAIGMKGGEEGNFDTAFGHGQWINTNFNRLGESLLSAIERRLMAGAVVRAA